MKPDNEIYVVSCAMSRSEYYGAYSEALIVAERWARSGKTTGPIYVFKAVALVELEQPPLKVTVLAE